MKTPFNKSITIIGMLMLVITSFIACSNTDDTSSEEESTDEVLTVLPSEFTAFNTTAVSAYLSDGGKKITIETTGLPNHKTVYYGSGHALYQAEPNVQVTPSIISSNNNATTMTVDGTPNLTGSTVATQLNTIGISVSGSSLFNDSEGNGPLSQAAASLDWTGAHIGPGVYHYHLEPVAFSNDDDKLVGVLKDGVFIYGRKCHSTGAYPTNLDASGGHTTATQYTNSVEKYHYHIINEVYSSTGSYIVFAGPYQGY
jgi:hypothetical protein